MFDDITVQSQFVSLSLVPDEETTSGGIVLPGDRPRNHVGIVEGIGPAVPASFRRHVKVGDCVAFQKGLQYDLNGMTGRPERSFVYYFDVLAKVDGYEPGHLEVV